MYFYLTIACLLLSASGASKDSKIEGPIIGIDLGTTFSCVGIYRNDKVDIIPNDLGNRITPSYVAFTRHGEKLIGESAKNQAALNPTNTIFLLKHLIGVNYTEDTVQRLKRQMPYEILNKYNKPYIRVSINGLNQDLTPEEISSLILKKLRDMAEIYLNQEVKHAVITVPDYFTNSQRQATIDAGKRAGLNVVRIIDDQVAAAMAYALNMKEQNKKNMLILDLGGGSFKASILTIENKKIKVITSSENIELGGEDFDLNIMRYFIELFKKKTNKDVTNNKNAIFRLKKEIENAKNVLFFENQAKIYVQNFHDGIDFYETLTKDKYMELNYKLFEKTMELIEMVIDDAIMEKNDIDEIILVGGLSRIPRIQLMLKEYFDSQKLNIGIDPEEVIAYGAAVQGYILSGEGSKKVDDIEVVNITALSLGVGVVGGSTSVIIPRGTIIPTKMSSNFTTTYDNQESMQLNIFEGEGYFTKDNHNLGRSIELHGISPEKKGIPLIEIIFEINSNGFLIITAVELGKKNKNSNIINYYEKKLNKTEIKKNIRNYKNLSLQKEEAKKIVEYTSQIKYFTTILDFYTEGSINVLSKSLINMIKNVNDHIIGWLNLNSHASIEDYQNKYDGIDVFYNAIISDVFIKIMVYNVLDKESQKRVDLKNQIESYAFLIMKLSKEIIISKNSKNTLEESVCDNLSWLGSNKNASYSEYQNKLKNIKDFYNSIALMIHFDTNKLTGDNENMISKIDTRKIIELYVYFTKYVIAKPNNKLDSTIKDIINKEIDDIMSWVTLNSKSSKDEYQNKLKSAEELYILSYLVYFTSQSIIVQEQEARLVVKNQLELYANLMNTFLRSSVGKLNDSTYNIIKIIFEDIIPLITVNNNETKLEYQIKLEQIQKAYTTIALFIKSNVLAENNEEAKAKLDVKNKIELHAYWIKKLIEEPMTKFSDSYKDMVNQVVDSLLLGMKIDDDKSIKEFKSVLKLIKYFHNIVSSSYLDDDDDDYKRRDEL